MPEWFVHVCDECRQVYVWDEPIVQGTFHYKGIPKAGQALSCLGVAKLADDDVQAAMKLGGLQAACVLVCMQRRRMYSPYPGHYDELGRLRL